MVPVTRHNGPHAAPAPAPAPASGVSTKPPLVTGKPAAKIKRKKLGPLRTRFRSEKKEKRKKTPATATPATPTTPVLARPVTAAGKRVAVANKPKKRPVRIITQPPKKTSNTALRTLPTSTASTPGIRTPATSIGSSRPATPGSAAATSPRRRQSTGDRVVEKLDRFLETFQRKETSKGPKHSLPTSAAKKKERTKKTQKTRKNPAAAISTTSLPPTPAAPATPPPLRRTKSSGNLGGGAAAPDSTREFQEQPPLKKKKNQLPHDNHPLVARSRPVLKPYVSVSPHKPYPVTSIFDPSQERVPKSWHDGPSRALIIGLSYKQQRGVARPLNGTINDARKVRQMLLDMGYPEDEIGVLLDDDERFKMPKTDVVMRAIMWLVDGATSNHRLFFYFAGHGSQVEDHNGDEQDGRDEVLRMADGAGIVDDWLNEEMLQGLPEGCHFTALFDCCHSGTALDLPHNYSPRGDEVIEKAPDAGGAEAVATAYEKAIFTTNAVIKRTRAHVVLFSACADREVAWDAKFRDEFCVINKGLFTEYFVRNVYNKMLDVNRAISYQELLRCTSEDVIGWCHANRDRLPNRRKYQTPQLSSGKPLDVHGPALM